MDPQASPANLLGNIARVVAQFELPGTDMGARSWRPSERFTRDYYTTAKATGLC